VRTIPVPAGSQAAPLAPKRLLALRGDDKLVEQFRRGNEAGFEAAFERYGGQILSFCRHMLGSLEEAEDVVQHTFAVAYRDLLDDDRAINLKPWLYAIARNRCLSVLRARRESSSEEIDVPTAGLDEQVQQRAELRELVQDVQDLPADQRAALLLAELGDLSHPEVAGVLGCEVPKVKALVFRARSGLMERRQARETSCAEIREQLSNLRGGALRRSELRHHLRTCEGCRAFREQVKRQRQLMAAILPVTPSLGFKSSVLAAIGIGGGSAGGGAAGGGAAGLGLSAAGLSSGTVAKIAAVALVAGGGAVGGEALVDRSGGDARGSNAPSESVGPGGGEQGTGGDGAASEPVAGRTPRRVRGARGKASTVTKGRGRDLPLNGPATPGSKAHGKAGGPPARGAPLRKNRASPPNNSAKARGLGIPETAPPSTPPVRRRRQGVRRTPRTPDRTLDGTELGRGVGKSD